MTSGSSLICLVTGAAGGIGQQVVRQLAEKQFHVMATDFNLDALKNVAKMASWPDDLVSLCALDVTKTGDWSACIQEIQNRWHRLDVLFNIAGYLKPGFIEDITDEDIDRHTMVNFKGVALGCHYAAEVMKRQKKGHIINVASMAALVPVPGLSLYSASKYAVRSFSLACAQELKSFGIAVTVVCPDPVETPMLRLQEDYVAAAITFTTSKVLRPENVATVLTNRVLLKRPREVTLPPLRGLLARLGDFLPSLTEFLMPIMRKSGLKKQQQRVKIRMKT